MRRVVSLVAAAQLLTGCISVIELGKGRYHLYSDFTPELRDRARDVCSDYVEVASGSNSSAGGAPVTLESTRTDSYTLQTPSGSMDITRTTPVTSTVYSLPSKSWNLDIYCPNGTNAERRAKLAELERPRPETAADRENHREVQRSLRESVSDCVKQPTDERCAEAAWHVAVFAESWRPEFVTVFERDCAATGEFKRPDDAASRRCTDFGRGLCDGTFKGAALTPVIHIAKDCTRGRKLIEQGCELYRLGLERRSGLRYSADSCLQAFAEYLK